MRAAVDSSNGPPDLWEKCSGCREMIYRRDLERNLKVCPKCGHHFRLGVAERLAYTVDPDSFREYPSEDALHDPLEFPEYMGKLRGDQAKTGLSEAIVIGEGRIHGLPAVLAIMDMRFRGGSMGFEVGERVVRAVDQAMAKRWPLIIFAASGGARMQESLISLMQMAKTSAAMGRLTRAGVPSINVITDMTYAGVLASFTSLGDIILAEPRAAMGFTGPRVIELSLKVRIPPESQRAEFQCEHGMLDAIVERREMRDTLGTILRWCWDGPPEAVAAGEEAGGQE
ncbi:MAG: acetyl-CoA carboxylase carboxyltransferase subunit beta [Armatimonadota bacterium]